MNAAGGRWGAASLLVLVACAAQPAAPAVAPGAEAGPPPAEGAAPYERILGAFVQVPIRPVLLDPRSCQEVACGSAEQAEALAVSAQALGAPGIWAAARLNLGALLWQDGQADRAYQEVRAAQALFAEVGDAAGLAVSHEWIGVMLLASGAPVEASDHLALAFQLYQHVDDRAGADRLLHYGEAP